MGSRQGVSTALPVRHPHRGPHRSANQESEADAAKPIILEQKYRPAAHGSKPIPVYDARDWGDV